MWEDFPPIWGAALGWYLCVDTAEQELHCSSCTARSLHGSIYRGHEGRALKRRLQLIRVRSLSAPLRSSPLLSGDAVTTEQLPVRSLHSARLTAFCTAPPTGDRQTAVSGDGARGGNLHLSCAHCGIKPEYRGGKLTRLRQGATPDCCPQTEVRGWPLFYYAWWPDKEISRGWNGALRSDLQSVVFIIMLHQHHSELRSSPWPSSWNFSLICSLQHYSSLNHNSEIT